MRYPETIGRATEFYEVSADFWQKMASGSHKNEMNLFRWIGSSGLIETDEARESYVDRVRNLEQGYARWSRVFSEILARMDSKRDRLFYYALVDERATENSSEGVVIVRNGRIHDKIVLNGKDAWETDAVGK